MSPEPIREKPNPMIGRRIGRYVIVRELGEGGMGSVYAARRDEDQQLVAIKILRRDVFADNVFDRFTRERQILARLSHPNIAALLDGGATPDGQPYFVLEFVDGLPVTEHCEKHRLSIADRIRLFQRICHAVEYAHQNLVVHRDLKPGNIFVTAAGEPKLLDFGIARLMEGESPTSQPTAVSLTPDYASPEQVRGEPVTTATDVYSLGVVLYELLTGLKPREFRTTTAAEIERLICDTEPARPSASISRRSDLPPRVRSQMRRRLAGDLDNIVLKAMSADPEKRYASVEAFADDLQRFLVGQPVQARPDTMLYRVRKFVRRRRVLVLAASVVAGSLICAIIATHYQAQKAQRRFDQVHRLASVFLFDVYAKVQDVPGSVQLRAQMIRTAIEYFENLRQDAAGDPQLAFELSAAFLRIGDVQGSPFFPNLGQTGEALASYRKSLALRQELVRSNPGNPQYRLSLAESHFKVSDMISFLGDAPGGVEEVRKGIAAIENDGGATEKLPERYRILAGAYNRVGDQQRRDGQADQALSSFQKGLELHREWAARLPGDRSKFGLAISYSRLADAYARLGNVDEAIRNSSIALELRQELFRSNPNGLNRRSLIVESLTLANLHGNPLVPNTGDIRKAVELYDSARSIAAETLRNEPGNAQAKNDVALVEFGRGLMTETVPMVRNAIQAADQLATGAVLSNSYYRHNQITMRLALSELLRKSGDTGAAREIVRQVESLLSSMTTRENDELRWSYLIELGEVSLAAGDAASAGDAWNRAGALMDKAVSARSSDVNFVRQRAWTHLQSGKLLRAAGDTAAACSSFRKASDLWEGVIARAGENRFLTREYQPVRDQLRTCPRQ